MSEDAAAPEATEPEAEPFDRDRAQAKIKKANDEARNLRERLKELEPLAQEAERLREASKTEAERHAERAAAAEQRAADAEARALRLEVAADKGLTPAQAKRLVGGTREELEADADELLATFRPPEAKPTIPDFDLGVRGAATPDPQDAQGRIALGLAQAMKTR